MQPIKKIAVLGAGSGGFMCSADMGSMGLRWPCSPVIS